MTERSTSLSAVEDPVAVPQGLSPEEDDELRRLNYMQQQGLLAYGKRERFLWLRLRDRRDDIRAPREFGEAHTERAPDRRRRWTIRK